MVEFWLGWAGVGAWFGLIWLEGGIWRGIGACGGYIVLDLA